MVKGLKKIQVAVEMSRLYMAIRVECRYLENALQIGAATIASKLLITISVTHCVVGLLLWRIIQTDKISLIAK